MISEQGPTTKELASTHREGCSALTSKARVKKRECLPAVEPPVQLWLLNTLRATQRQSQIQAYITTIGSLEGQAPITWGIFTGELLKRCPCYIQIDWV